MSKNIEKRYITAELRAEPVEEGKLPMIVGYAAKFDSPSHPLPGKRGSFIEYIERGAFSRSLSANADVRALVDHDASKILGRTTAGTLRLVEDEVGLRVEIDTPDTSLGRDTLVSLQRGDLSQMSFGFFAKADEWKDDGKVRTLKDVDVFDVSIVTYPAYEDTSVAVRSLENWEKGLGTPIRDKAKRMLKLIENS